MILVSLWFGSSLDRTNRQTEENFRTATLVRVTRREVAGYFRALVDIAADRDQRRRRAGPVGLLKPVIAAVEARDHARAAVAARRLRIDQRLHLVAPFGAFVAAADATQIMQGAEDFGETLQVAVERRSGVLRARGEGEAGSQAKDGKKACWHGLRDSRLNALEARPPDLMFASLYTAGSKSERQIQSSTRFNILLVVL